MGERWAGALPNPRPRETPNPEHANREPASWPIHEISAGAYESDGQRPVRGRDRLLDRAPTPGATVRRFLSKSA